MEKQKPLNEWTLREVKEYCKSKGTRCGGCPFFSDRCNLNSTPEVWLIPTKPRWLHTDYLDGHTVGECSECHKIRGVDNFCPSCGAKMDLN